MNPWEMDYEEPEDSGPKPWEMEFAPAKKQSEDRPWDATIALKRGVEQVPGMLSGAADTVLGLFGADRPVDKLTDEIGQRTGFQPGKWAEDNMRNYSPELQAQMRDVDQAWADDSLPFVDKLGRTVRNPAVLGAKMVESIPSMIAGGVAGRGIGAATGISRVAAGAMGEGLVSAGQTMDQIPDSVDAQKAASAAAVSGAAVGGLGYAAGRIAARLGISDIDTMLAGGGRAIKDESAEVQRNLFTRFIGAASQEGILEEMPQSAVEQMAQNFATDKPLFDGLDRAMTEGALLGAAMGGGASILGTRPSRQTVDSNAQTSQDTRAGIDRGRDAIAPQAGGINDQLQENGSPNRLDAGTNQPDMGLHGQRDPVSAGLADAGGSGDVSAAATAGSNNVGEGADVSPLIEQIGTREVGKPHIEPVAQEMPTLPKELAGAKPKWRSASIEFDNDIDRALYITSQQRKSKADAQYREFLKQQGFDDAAIDQTGAQLRAHMKQLATDSGLNGGSGDVLQVPAFAQLPQQKPHYRMHAPQQKPHYKLHTPQVAQAVAQTVSPVPPQAAGNPATPAAPQNPAAMLQGPVNFDLYDNAVAPEHPKGVLASGLEAGRELKSNMQQDGMRGTAKRFNDWMTHYGFDNKWGAGRYLDQHWTVDTPNGKKMTPYAKLQYQEYAGQMAFQSMAQGAIEKNSEGMFIVRPDPANIRSIFEEASKIPVPQGKDPLQMFAGMMINLTYAERENLLNSKKATAAQELQTLQATMQGVTNPQHLAALQKQEAALQKTLNESYERPNVVTDQGMIDAAKMYTTDPQFKKAADLLHQFNEQNIKLAREGGLIDDETANEWRKNKFYVNLERQLQDPADPDYASAYRGPASNLGSNPTNKKFGGSTYDVKDIFENMRRQRLLIAEAAIRNDAALSALSYLAGNAPDAGVQFHTERPKHAKNAVSFFRDGKRLFATVNDPMAYETFAGIAMRDQGSLMKVIEKTTAAFRDLIMLSPDAIARNINRDILEAWNYKMTDRSLPGAYADVGKKIVQAYRGDQMPQASVARHGIVGDREYTTAEREMNRIMKRAQRTTTGGRDWTHDALSSTDSALASMFHRWEGVAFSAEMGTREHVYQETLKRTGSQTEAAMAAINHLDFRRRGQAQAITLLKQSIPFINSQLQGLHKLYRAAVMGETNGMNATDARMALLNKGLKLSALAVAYTMMMGSDDNWKDVDKKVRDHNILVPTGKDGMYLRIPLHFELGSIFWALPANAVMSAMHGQTNQELKDSLKELAKSVLPFQGDIRNAIPQVFKPAIEAAFNSDSYTDAPIVPQTMQGMKPEMQSRESTSTVAKNIGSALDVSPLKVDHVIRGYFGSIGQIINSTLGAVIDKASHEQRTDTPFYKYPVLRSLLTDPLNSEAKNQFYKLRDASKEVHDTVKEMQKRYDMAGMEKYLQGHTRGVSNEVLYNSYKSLNARSERLAQIHAQQRAIDMSRDSDPKIRRMQIDQLRKMEQDWMRTEVPELKKMLGE